MERFAVAARELEGGPRGMSRWLGEVLRGWRRAGRAKDVVLYVESALPATIDVAGYEVVPTGPGPGGGATAWEQWALPRRLNADRPAAVLGPANAIPLLARSPGVLVLHDLSFEAHPEWFHGREGMRRRLLARAGVRRAASVVVNSAFTAAELDRLYSVRGARVRVAPLGVPERFRPAPPALSDEVRRRLGLGSGDVVLAVGSLFERRHLPELARAFARLAAERPELRLVIVGDNRTHPPLDVEALLRQTGIAGRTTWIEAVDEETLVALYSLARVAVYLSDYEGFGLPPLEALACGCPVVASATSALVENLTGRAELVPDHTPEHIAAAIERVLAALPSPALRPEWLAAYSWERTAAEVMRALEEAR